jgi:hypothetical protein
MTLQSDITMQKDCCCLLEIRKHVIDATWDVSLQPYSEWEVCSDEILARKVITNCDSRKCANSVLMMPR